MGKRGSGAPRHPRSPVAKAVRTPAFKMQVVADSEVVGGSAALRIRRAPSGYKRWKNMLKEAGLKEAELKHSAGDIKADDADKSKD